MSFTALDRHCCAMCDVQARVEAWIAVALAAEVMAGRQRDSQNHVHDPTECKVEMDSAV